MKYEEFCEIYGEHFEAIPLLGKRLEKFNTSIDCFMQSLEHGSWLKGMSRKADSGFYQGIISGSIPEAPRDYRRENRNLFELYMTLKFGHGKYEGDLESDYKVLRDVAEADTKRYRGFLKLGYASIVAWVELSRAKQKAKAWLDSARPVPVITDMGASPTVTKTLEEMDLHLTASSLRYPELEKKVEEYEEANFRTGKLEKKRHVYYVIKWAKGCKHNRSRFAGSSPSGHMRCHACGHAVPSGMLVPLEGQNSKGQWFSLLLGCDCAQTLFGVKDIGVEVNVDKNIEYAKQRAKELREKNMREQGR